MCVKWTVGSQSGESSILSREAKWWNLDWVLGQDVSKLSWGECLTRAEAVEMRGMKTLEEWEVNDWLDVRGMVWASWWMVLLLIKRQPSEIIDDEVTLSFV